MIARAIAKPETRMAVAILVEPSSFMLQIGFEAAGSKTVSHTMLPSSDKQVPHTTLPISRSKVCDSVLLPNDLDAQAVGVADHGIGVARLPRLGKGHVAFEQVADGLGEVGGA